MTRLSTPSRRYHVAHPRRAHRVFRTRKKRRERPCPPSSLLRNLVTAVTLESLCVARSQVARISFANSLCPISFSQRASNCTVSCCRRDSGFTGISSTIRVHSQFTFKRLDTFDERVRICAECRTACIARLGAEYFSGTATSTRVMTFSNIRYLASVVCFVKMKLKSQGISREEICIVFCSPVSRRTRCCVTSQIYYLFTTTSG